MKAIISDIKRFAVHDGDGIRTTVFIKGCPLKCMWCHNPESIDIKPQLAYYKEKCIGCGECTEYCPSGAQQISIQGHSFNRNLCIACGQCENVCLGDALKFYGKEMTLDKLLQILLKDKDYYQASGGGVTLSGGEALMQADFCAVLLKALKAENINTAVDTCGYLSKEALDKVISYTDIFLYDIKAIDEVVHINATGRSNDIILKNIIYLDSLGKKIEVRIPLIPEFNADQIEKIRDFLKPLKNITAVKILPYHNFCASKYSALGIKNTLPNIIPTSEDVKKAERFFR